ncbi:MAG: polyprenyl synthetase family protein [Clostridia bacterium]
MSPWKKTMNLSDFHCRLTACREMVDEALMKTLDGFSGCPPALKEAMRYSICAGGKRVRPMLLILTYEASGKTDLDGVMPFACALEMIHTYSLIHDDLPAMDNDDYRRGIPTSHKVHGEALAILAGDALLNGAFEVMLDHATTEQAIRAASIIARASGAGGMIGGQVYDLEGTRDEASLMQMHAMKTGKLIEAAVLAGGCLSSAKPGTMKKLQEYAVHIGIAFQIRDDILDVTSSRQSLGKDPGSDEKNAKMTYPVLFGIKGSLERQAMHTRSAVDALVGLPKAYGILAQFADMLEEREG